jgi:hypothetical protein
VSGTYIGTTHQDAGRRGSHRSQGRQRFAIKTTGLARGAPVKSQTAPWYLKRALSRPEAKQTRPPAIQAVA